MQQIHTKTKQQQLAEEQSSFTRIYAKKNTRNQIKKDIVNYVKNFRRTIRQLSHNIEHTPSNTDMHSRVYISIFTLDTDWCKRKAKVHSQLTYHQMNI